MALLGGYMRVSSKGDRDPDRWLTVPHQREAIERWCRDHGHRLVDLRQDIDVSGASADRPNLEQLVEQIEAGNLAGIVVAKLDRFSRWLPHGVNTLRQTGVRMRSDGRILTTHTGSLPRTPDLGAMIDARERGAEVDSTAFRRVAEAAVDRVVVKQLEAGIDVGSDGEQPRASYCTYAADRMRGFGGESHRAPLSDFVDYPEFAAHYAKRFMSDDAMARQPAAIGDVVYEDLAGVDEELDIFKSVLERQQKQFADAFMTASSPGVMVLMMRNQHYPTEGDYIAALAPEIAKEYQRIVERDLILQVDCPDLPAERITNYVDVPFNEYLGIVERNIGELNRSLEGVPPERVRMHCCWGNYAGPHTRDPALRDLMSRLYEANVGTLVLPFGNPRHEHEIDVFREFPLPDDMAVVVGVIDVTTNWVEHPKLIAKRLVTAAEAIGDPTRVIAGTDCGFGTFWDYALVADEVVWLKLKALREGADLASEQLWR